MDSWARPGPSYKSLSKPRILAVGHGAAATGFARVLDTLIQHLSHKYEFHHFATNHRSERVAGDWPIYGNADRLDANGRYVTLSEGIATKVAP